MAAQYIIQPNKVGNYEVYWREAPAKEELIARMQKMLEDGMTAEEISINCAVMRDSSTRCNLENAGYSLKQCAEFVASYIHPGDCVIFLGVPFIVNQAGKA